MHRHLFPYSIHAIAIAGQPYPGQPVSFKLFRHCRTLGHWPAWHLHNQSAPGLRLFQPISCSDKQLSNPCYFLYSIALAKM